MLEVAREKRIAVSEEIVKGKEVVVVWNKSWRADEDLKGE